MGCCICDMYKNCIECKKANSKNKCELHRYPQSHQIEPMPDKICAHICQTTDCKDHPILGSVWGSGEKYIDSHIDQDDSAIYHKESVVEELREALRKSTECLLKFDVNFNTSCVYDAVVILEKALNEGE